MIEALVMVSGGFAASLAGGCFIAWIAETMTALVQKAIDKG